MLSEELTIINKIQKYLKENYQNIETKVPYMERA